MRSLKDTFLWLAERFGQAIPGPSIKVLLFPPHWKWELKLDWGKVFCLGKKELTELGVFLVDDLPDDQPICPTLFGIYSCSNLEDISFTHPKKRPVLDMALWRFVLDVPESFWKIAEDIPEIRQYDPEMAGLLLTEGWNPHFESLARRAALELTTHWEVDSEAPKRYYWESWCSEWLRLLVESRFASQDYWQVVEKGRRWRSLSLRISIEKLDRIFREAGFFKNTPSKESQRFPCPIFTHIFDAALLSEEICLQIAKDGYIAENIWEQMESPPEENPRGQDSGPLLPIIEQKNAKKKPLKPRCAWRRPAIRLVEKHPELPDSIIAKAVGISPSTLSEDQEFQKKATEIRGALQKKYASARAEAVFTKEEDGGLVLDGKISDPEIDTL